ncbi:MAG: GMC family oxidoreductase [bacterium]|nr:GMC family oxidoreductase [bacterium]
MTSGKNIDADVVIIGSGVAGAITACRLAERGVKNIVVLEAGPRIDRAATVQNFMKSPYADASSGYPNTAHAPRPDWNTENAGSSIVMTGPVATKTEYLRVVGGTTWHWGGSTPRLHPADFALRKNYGVGHDWPFGYDTLAPYYNEAEKELGVAGDSTFDDGSPRDMPFPMPPIPLSFCDKQIAKGLPDVKFFSRPVARASVPYRGRSQCEGFGSCMPVCPSGAQYTAADHVAQAEKLGVRVIENARVDRIVADGSVKYVEAKRPDGSTITVRGKIFVLAANGMETPRLLLMSAGESHVSGIANRSGQVGRNFMDHPTLIFRLLMPKPVWPGRGPVTIMASHDFRDGAFRKQRPGWIISTENRSGISDISRSLIAQGVEPPALDAAIRDRTSREINILASTEQLPDPQNGITLDWSKRDSAGQPVMRHYYSIGDYEQNGLDHIRRDFANYAKTLGAELGDTFGPLPIHHQMGMTRMGDDAKTSVTDHFGRCHDHANLFIAGASLFPSSSCVNPTLTIAALALRTADEIMRQLKP